MKRKWKQAITAVTLAAFLSTGLGVANVGYADTLGNLQNQQSDIKNQKNQINKQLNEKKKTEKTLNQQLTELNRQLGTVQQAIDDLDNQMKETEDNIAFTAMEIENKQRDYDGRLAILNLRLKEMYEYGDVNFLEVLMNSSSFTDFLSRFEYLRYIAANDQKLLDEVVQRKETLEADKVRLDELIVSLEAQKKEQEAKSVELADASAKQATLVKQIKAEEKVLYDELDELEAESKQIAAVIKQIQAEQAAKNGTSKAPGSYLWPCPASHIVTSNYGYRVNPVSKVYKLHAGMDIGAAYGSAVIAAASGTVIKSEYYGGYGNCIIIDHGGGVATLYGHMSSLIAKNGQKVTAGQTIGKVGSTGNSTGNHLHFEVRINGSTVNPAGYVK